LDSYIHGWNIEGLEHDLQSVNQQSLRFTESQVKIEIFLITQMFFLTTPTEQFLKSVIKIDFKISHSVYAASMHISVELSSRPEEIYNLISFI